MLAYLVWHVPAAELEAAAYEQRLAGFHAALRADPSPGLGATATFGLGRIPWLDGAAGYEDWYLVDDFRALGELNEAAVAGSRRPSHDAAATGAASLVAGVMGHVAGAELPKRPAWAAWTSKPAGVPYPDAHATLAAALSRADAAAWQRQMTLGPATEYCVLADAPVALPWPLAHAWVLREVVAPAR